MKNPMESPIQTQLSTIVTLQDGRSANSSLQQRAIQLKTRPASHRARRLNWFSAKSRLTLAWTHDRAQQVKHFLIVSRNMQFNRDLISTRVLNSNPRAIVEGHRRTRSGWIQSKILGSLFDLKSGNRWKTSPIHARPADRNELPHERATWKSYKKDLRVDARCLFRAFQMNRFHFKTISSADGVLRHFRALFWRAYSDYAGLAVCFVYCEVYFEQNLIGNWVTKQTKERKLRRKLRRPS